MKINSTAATIITLTSGAYAWTVWSFGVLESGYRHPELVQLWIALHPFLLLALLAAFQFWQVRSLAIKLGIFERENAQLLTKVQLWRARGILSMLIACLSAFGVLSASSGFLILLDRFQLYLDALPV